MAVSNALRRLLQVRDLEEEQHKLALDSALAELHRLGSALHAARARERTGRALIAASAHSGDAAERVAGIVENEAGHHHAELLTLRRVAAEQRAASLRQEYLAKRVERRQVETVIQEAEAQETIEERRRDQQSADERFGMRHHAQGGEPPAIEVAAGANRPGAAKHEIKIRQESAHIPEAEPRFKL
jgi:hypothetical protein